MSICSAASPTVQPIDALIDRIATQVRLGDAKRDQALEHYRLAGEALVELKAECQAVGVGFKALVEGDVYVTYRHAARLMRLAREWPCTWDRWQEICGNGPASKPKVEPPAPDPLPVAPTEDDFEYARKLVAMKHRGGTDNERSIASSKLSAFAGNFGMTESELEDVLSEQDAAEEETKTEQQGMSVYAAIYNKWLRECATVFQSAGRDVLLEVVAQLYTELEVAGVEPPKYRGG